MQPKSIGKQIKDRRTSFGISQEMVASSVGRDQTWISLVERGRLVIDDIDAAKILEAIDRIGREIQRVMKEVMPRARVCFDDLVVPDRRGKRNS